MINPKITISANLHIEEIKDRQPRYYTLERDIRLISAELYRLISLPYASWNNKAKIRTLENQIIYMEELLAAYERDQKKLE